MGVQLFTRKVVESEVAMMPKMATRVIRGPKIMVLKSRFQDRNKFNH